MQVGANAQAETPTVTMEPTSTHTLVSTPTDTATPSVTPKVTFTLTPTAIAIHSLTPSTPQTYQMTYTYDGDGNPVKSVLGDVVTHYVGNHYEKKVRGNQQNERKYYFAGANRIAMRENGTLTWLISDHLGSTSVTADAGGNLLSSLRYSAFGELRAASGATGTDYRYTGQRSEAEIGLYYYVARFYDPALGRFISADSIVPGAGNPMAWDRYAYVNNNPINATDPTGHAMKLDDGGSLRECPANSCYIKLVGYTPGLPYFPISSVTYGQNAANTSSGGGSMDGTILPDVTDPRFSIQTPTFKDPSAVFGGLGIINDLALYLRNRAVETEDSRINVFAFYKVEEDGYSVQSLDIHNPTGADVSVKQIDIILNQGGYNVKPGPRIQSPGGNYYFSPVVNAKNTTTVSIVPSGFTGNQTNTSLNPNIRINVLLVQTQTGMIYKWIQGTIR